MDEVAGEEEEGEEEGSNMGMILGIGAVLVVVIIGAVIGLYIVLSGGSASKCHDVGKKDCGADELANKEDFKDIITDQKGDAFCQKIEETKCAAATFKENKQDCCKVGEVPK